MIKTFICLFSILLLVCITFNTNIYAMYEKGGGTLPKGMIETKQNEVFGSASMICCSYYGKTKRISEDNYKNSYVELDKYFYTIFKYNSLLDAPIKRITNIERLEVGNELNVSYIFSHSVSDTYETSLKQTVSNSTNISFKNGVNIYEMFETSADLSNQITISKEYENRFSKTYTINEGYSISTKVSPKDLVTYWSYNIRAKFSVYKIYVYEVLYNQMKETHKTWYGKKYNTYSYTLNEVKKIEETYRYEYSDNTLYAGLFEYTLLYNGKYSFKNKDTNFLYLD